MYSSMDQPSPPVCIPCYCNGHKQGAPNLSNVYRQPPRENYVPTQNTMPYPEAGTTTRNQPYRNTQENDSCSSIDDQTLNVLSTYRQKATQFLRSDSENCEGLYGVPNQKYRYQSTNVYRSPNVLRQANDLLDYTPQSEFLKKMKQQCQYLQNNQQNVFTTLDSCDGWIPHECQKCIEKVKELLATEEQVKGSKYRPQSEGGRDSCPCSHRLRELYNANDCNTSQRVQREPGTLARNNKGGVNEEEKILQKASVCTAGSGGRSEHMSRSKKVKCRERRKRKSDSSDKCESEEEFEPNLKKPHENSCERCWRYASPSRSPVNKPDQRYDPNFRRGHSYTDFNNERGDGDLEVAGKYLPTSRNMRSITSKDKTPSLPSPPQSPRQQREVKSQNTQLSAHKCDPQAGLYRQMNAQLNPQTPVYGQQKTQFSPQIPAYCQQKVQCTPQNYQFANQQHQLEQSNSSFTKIKHLMYNYSQLKSPGKDSPRVQPSSQPCQYNGRKSPSPGILESDSGRKPRPKSHPGVVPNIYPEASPSYVLDDYHNVYTKPKQAQQNGTNKNPARINGNKTECFCGKKNVGSPVVAGRPVVAGSPVLAGSPVVASSPVVVGSPFAACSPVGGVSPAKAVPPSVPVRPGTSPKPSSSPQQCSKPKTSGSPVQSARTPSSKADTAKPKGSKTPSPKAKATKSPKTSPNLCVSFDTPGTDSTGYAEVSIKKTPKQSTPKNSPSDKSPKKSPPKRKPKTSESPRRSPKSSPKASPKRVRSSTDCVENVATGQKERPQTGTGPKEQCQRGFDLEGVERYYPNSPHLVRDCWCPPRAPFVKGYEAGASGTLFCCHCNWEENLKKREAEQRAGRAANEVNQPLPKIPSEDVLGMECPYRAYQAEDKSWMADYQNMKELLLNESRETRDRTVRSRPQSEANSTGTGSRRYHVYYMTQSKRNKGDDVEVLVEEFTKDCPKPTDWRTKDITDKMKRIMECPSDSMALRFQKGVSESSKTPRSSRILYF